MIMRGAAVRFVSLVDPVLTTLLDPTALWGPAFRPFPVGGLVSSPASLGRNTLLGRCASRWTGLVCHIALRGMHVATVETSVHVLPGGSFGHRDLLPGHWGHRLVVVVIRRSNSSAKKHWLALCVRSLRAVMRLATALAVFRFPIAL